MTRVFGTLAAFGRWATSRTVVASGLEVAGFGVVAYGVSLLAVWAGLVAAGVGLVLVGVSLDPPRRGSA